MTTDTITHDIRTRRLRRQADRMHPVVAQAYRRRACELDLERWARHCISIGPVEIG